MRVPVAASTQSGKSANSVAQSHRVARRDQNGSLVVSAKGLPRTPSKRVLARQEQLAQFRRMIDQLVRDDQVFEVALSPEEKPFTVRQQLIRVASNAGKEIAAR